MQVKKLVNFLAIYFPEIIVFFGSTYYLYFTPLFADLPLQYKIQSHLFAIAIFIIVSLIIRSLWKQVSDLFAETLNIAKNPNYLKTQFWVKIIIWTLVSSILLILIALIDMFKYGFFQFRLGQQPSFGFPLPFMMSDNSTNWPNLFVDSFIAGSLISLIIEVYSIIKRKHL